LRVENLRRAISSIESRLGGLNNERTPDTPISAPAMRAFGAMPDQNIRADDSVGRIARQMEGLRRELAELRADKQSVGHGIGPAAFNKAVFQLQQGMDDAAVRDERHQSLIATRLERLGESLAEVETAAFNSSQRQEKVFSDKLDDIRQTVGDLPGALSLNRLEERLEHVQGKIDQLTKAADASIIAQQRMIEARENAVAREDLTQIETRLDEIARAVIAASSAGSFDETPPQIDLPGIDRIEAQVAELSRTVDRIADVQDEGLGHRLPDLGGLEGQLAKLSSRLESFSVQQTENDTLSQIEQQIQALAGRVETRPNDALNAIEKKMGELARSVEKVTSVPAATPDLGHLDKRLADVTRALATSQPSADPVQMQAFLSQIEGEFARTASATAVEAAQAAAERVLATRSGDQTLQALSEDLKILRHLAENDSHQTVQITRTLQALADRLENFEVAPAPISYDVEELNRPHELETAPLEEAVHVDDPVDDAIAQANAVREAAQLDTAELNGDLSTVEELEEAFRNEELLEPGTVPADVLDDAEEPEMEPAPDIKSDAVAAARRALQATSDEVAAIDENEARAPRNRRERRAAKAATKVKGRSTWHRPILVAAAAVLLALSAYQGYQLVEGADPRHAAIEETSVRIMTIKDEARPGVSLDDQAPVAENIPASDPAPISVSTPSRAPQVTPADVPAISNTDNIVTGAIQRETFDLPASIGTATFVAAANAGNPSALYELGTRYSNGEGVEKNLKEAAKWMQKAAEAGFAPAQYSYGSMLQKGLGVETDLPAAARWYGRASQQGNARAIHNLAFLAVRSARKDVPEDMEKAVAWFNEAANFGLKDSQFNLGIVHGRGIGGVEKNPVEAYKWFAIAAKSGDQKAIDRRDEIKADLTAEQLKAAQAEVDVWAAQPLNEEANSIAIPDAWRGAASAETTLEPDVVKEVQVILNNKGFLVGAPDGVMGERTLSAIKKFQRSAGIPATGKVDERLMRALRA
jgi:localization factor PodJL